MVRGFKGLIVVIMLVIALILGVFSASAVSSEKSCRNECTSDKRENMESCLNLFNNCKETCKENEKSCIEELKYNRTLCYDDCKNTSLNSSSQKKCMKSCSYIYQSSVKNCSSSICSKECTQEKNYCSNAVAEDFNDCSSKCRMLAKYNTTLSCNDDIYGQYSAGDKYVKGCELCKCGYTGNISCKDTQYCNFDESQLVDEESICEDSGGYYQPLCHGPFYDVKCDRKPLCQCEGINNYTCPENSICLKEISTEETTISVPGWTDMLGNSLGDVGICVNLPKISTCGNGICDNRATSSQIEIYAAYAETSYNCAEDCI